MERGEKHIIPRDQYRRKRRVFTDEGEQRMEPREGQAENRASGPENPVQEHARRQQEYERTREFQSDTDEDGQAHADGPLTRRQNLENRNHPAEDDRPEQHLGQSAEGEPRPRAVSGDNHSGMRGNREFLNENSGMESSTDPDLNPNQNPKPEPERDPDFDAESTPERNQPGRNQREETGADRPPDRSTDPDYNAAPTPDPNQPGREADVDRRPDAGRDPDFNAAPTPEPNQPTQDQKEEADPDADYGPGESGYRDRSAPAGGVGVIPPGNAGGDNYSRGNRDRGEGKEPPREDNDGTGNGSGGGGRRSRRGRGCLGAFLIPLIMGALGALLVLLLFNFFGDNGEIGTPGTKEGQETTGDSEDAGMTDEARQEIDGIKEQIQQDSGDTEKEVSDTTAAVQKAKQSVVSVINLQKAGEFMPGLTEAPQAEPEEAGTGSGVIYKLTEDTAYIVTNNHVVEGAEEIQVNLASGDQLQAQIIGTDVWTDLAVLEVDRGEIDSAIEFADSDELLVGETAIAIGSPLGEAFSGSVSQGIVSGLDRSVPVDIDGDGNYDWESNVIQTDAAINPGNSGGALVDAAGNLIGINSMKISMPTVEGIGFAIPSNEVQQIVTQLEENGEVTRAYLGIQLQDLYTVPAEVLASEMNLPEDVKQGVIVSNVQEGTPAAAGGLEQLDVIVSLDGQEIQNMLELRKYLYYEKEQGEEMTIEFYRNGELEETTVTLE
ncbi:trypsin-like peptidase domain-containing protein [Salinicoccus sp. HZC-1]|uniref:trypsin-like peptidase domain-containing protein n=1 Tax=Salinicoccus sp. HZC-1 TaxID=3385497 RepID=UPI00398A6072